VPYVEIHTVRLLALYIVLIRIKSDLSINIDISSFRLINMGMSFSYLNRSNNHICPKRHDIPGIVVVTILWITVRWTAIEAINTYD